MNEEFHSENIVLIEGETDYEIVEANETEQPYSVVAKQSQSETPYVVLVEEVTDNGEIVLAPNSLHGEGSVETSEEDLSNDPSFIPDTDCEGE